MKGRKPKQGAQRRGGTEPVPVEVLIQPEQAQIIEPDRAQKPAHIAANPIQSACWDDLVGASPNFAPCDVPLLEAYCYWYAVLRQSETQTIDSEGKVITMVGQYGKEGELMKYVGHPDIRTAEKATTMLRQLGDALNLTPTARDRAGLMQAMTRSTQADVVRKTLDGYEEFKKRQKALNAAK